MEIKSCEEYVLNELENTRNELALANKQIEELKEQLNARTIEELPEEELPKSKTYTISEQPNYYYYYKVCRYYDINTLLKANNKTPDFLKQVLENEEAYNEYCGLHAEESYSNYVGGQLVRSTYDMLLVNYYNKKSIIFIDYAMRNDLRDIDNSNYFLDENKARQVMKEVVFEEIKDYFNSKKEEQFKPKVETNE